MVLAVSGAHQVTHDEEPQLFNVVEEMTIAAGLPQVPAVYVIEEAGAQRLRHGPRPAARLHRRHARAAADRSTARSSRASIAHEMSHIRNYDIRFATLVGILVGHDRPGRRLLPALELLGRHGPARGGGSSAATRPAPSS